MDIRSNLDKANHSLLSSTADRPEGQNTAALGAPNAMPEAPALAAEGKKDIQAYGIKATPALVGEMHLEADRNLLHQLIKKPTELHFYWTFGREVENIPVRIGGEAYYERFTRYVDKLLEVAPSLLTVVLALDELTLRANQSWIEAVQAKYPNRLEVCFVSDAQEKLEDAFPGYKATIHQVFANASRGNPVIASDIYRLLCMVDAAKADSTIFTYSDVDTFVYGCDTPNSEVQKRPQFDFQTMKVSFVEEVVEIPGHSNLMTALFQEPNFDSRKLKSGFFQERDPNTSFFLCRPMERETGYKNNDIVKFKVNTVGRYKYFSENILGYLNEYLGDDTKPMGILNYFTTLHACIKTCEGKDKEAMQTVFQDYLKQFSSLDVQTSAVIEITGPGLLDKRRECSALGVVHPRVASWEWHGTELLQGEVSGPLEAFSISKELNDMQGVFKVYVNRLNDALYAKRFGEDHPFYLALKEHLTKTFPYNTQGFEDLLQHEYDKRQKNNRDVGISCEEWKSNYLKRIKQKAPDDRPIEPGDSYYARLLSILATIGIQKE